MQADFSNYYFFYSFAAQYSPLPPPQKKPMETPAPWAVHENEFKYWDRALKIWSEMLILRKIPWKDRTVLKKYETLGKSLPRGMD